LGDQKLVGANDCTSRKGKVIRQLSRGRQHPVGRQNAAEYLPFQFQRQLLKHRHSRMNIEFYRWTDSHIGIVPVDQFWVVDQPVGKLADTQIFGNAYKTSLLLG
jgi:hypothetical protein